MTDSLQPHGLQHARLPSPSLGQTVSRNLPKFMPVKFSSVQFSRSFVSDSLRPHGLQHPGFPVHHQLPEPTQTHVHQVGDAIQSSHLLLSPSPPTFNRIRVFSNVSSPHQEAKVLGLQHQSFHCTCRTDFFQEGLVGPPCSPRDSQESSPTPQFKSVNSLVLSFLYSPTLTSILLGKP